jgi:hypothetical protein
MWNDNVGTRLRKHKPSAVHVSESPQKLPWQHGLQAPRPARDRVLAPPVVRSFSNHAPH